jgi:alanine racemase
VNDSAPLPRLEISIDALLHNCAVLRALLPASIGLLAVVKDRAYGCGSKQIALALEQYGGVSFFAVNAPAEAFYLREQGVKSDILVLGPAGIHALRQGSSAGMVFTLTGLDDIYRWQSAGIPVRFHCNIDTRMHRLGILPHEVENVINVLHQAPHLRFEGLFTHLADADDPFSKTVRQQIRLFYSCKELFIAQGIRPRHVHYANSGGILHFSPTDGTLVRPGITLYGSRPDPRRPVAVDLKPVVSLKSSVVKVTKVPAGTPVSYCGRYITDRDTHIATIALGYGCGYPRSLTNRGTLIIKGKRYTIAGTVTMDYCMVDAGPVPLIAAGDEVVAIGAQGGETITPDDIALLDGTIAYEILCGLSPSMDRTYVMNGNVCGMETGYIY